MSPTLSAPAPADGAPVTVRPMPPRPKLLLRGRIGGTGFAAAVEELIGIAPPAEANSSAGQDPALLWLSPTGWLLLGTADVLALGEAIRERLQGQGGDAIDVSDEYEQLRLEGPAAADLLATCCYVDFSSAAFPPGSVARTLAAGVPVIAHRASSDAALDLYVDRSYRDYLLDALGAAAREFACS